jgi:hypothetical protein
MKIKVDSVFQNFSFGRSLTLAISFVWDLIHATVGVSGGLRHVSVVRVNDRNRFYARSKEMLPARHITQASLQQTVPEYSARDSTTHECSRMYRVIYARSRYPMRFFRVSPATTALTTSEHTCQHIACVSSARHFQNDVITEYCCCA